MTNPTPTNKTIDSILEEYGYAIVNHPEASRASHIKTYKQAPLTYIKEEVIGLDGINDSNRDSGHDCYDKFCDYCELIVGDNLKAEQRNRLEQHE